MDQINRPKQSIRPSALPRPSKLPLPTSFQTRSLRPSPSRERLEADKGLSINRLRSAPPRQPLFSGVPTGAGWAVRRDLNSDGQRRTGVLHSTPVKTRNVQDSSFAGIKNQDEAEELNTDIAVSDEELPIAAESAFMPRSSRLSLSERTIETLSNSPLAKDRKSSFYSNKSPTRQQSRLGSGASSRSRRTSGSVSSSNTSSRTASYEQNYQPPWTQSTKQAPSLSLPLGSSLPRSRISSGPESVPAQNQSATRSESCSRPNATSNMSVSAFSKRSLPSRSETSREPLKAGQPRQSSKENPTPRSMNSTAKRMANETPKRAVISAAKSSAVRGPSQATRPPISKPVNASEEGEDPDPELEKRKVSNSSSALRETIARAKAARRELVARQTSTGEKKNNASKSSQVNAANSFAAESIVDDFEPGMLQDEHVNFLKKRVNAARTDGRLNISGMGLKAIPSEVIHMYDMDSVEAAGGSWYECVDLVRFIAADNEISEIEDHLFPDKQLSSAEFNEDEDHGNQFGGLELLDLHGNLLTSIPPGLRRLERLVTLNLSNNKLGQEALDIISEIESLQVLKLANNNLEGELEPSISRLKKLEVLDLRGNSITSLPRSLADLAELRNLNVSENRICSLPIDSLVSLPIRELVLSKNNLSGILFGRSVVSWSSLQFLDISNNNLVELSEEEEFHLPLLHTLALSFNSITSLPNISSWAELVTLTAEDNKLSSIPQGLSSLSKLKSADFTGNNIVTLDEHIGRMDSLDVLRVAGNPLRERKFLNMSTDQLKRDLASRLDPEPVDGSDAFDSEVPNPTTGYSSAKHPSSASLSKWPVQTDGKLDLSSKTLDDSNIHSIPFEELAISEYTIRNLLLSQNRLSLIPMSCLSIVSHSLVNLDLSHNSLKGSSYLPLSSPSPSSSSSPSSPSSSTAPSTSLPLTLPKLKSLSLAFNSITSLAPLQSSLQAPLLEYLNVSTNRITSLPVLRSTFPSLTTLLASENCIQDLTYEAVEGLAVVNLASNDIGSLPPRMGLLKGSLKSLDVKGNRFRVPKYTVLEKGTEATLDWLRGRIPADDDAEEVF